jgi:dipeptidase D
MMAEIFEMQTGRPMKVDVIHAGLECGWHIQKAPNLDMVSIGVTTHDIHSPKETLDLTTIAPQIRLVTETLRRIADGKCATK